MAEILGANCQEKGGWDLRATISRKFILKFWRSGGVFLRQFRTFRGGERPEKQEWSKPTGEF